MGIVLISSDRGGSVAMATQLKFELVWNVNHRWIWYLGGEIKSASGHRGMSSLFFYIWGWKRFTQQKAQQRNRYR